MTKKSSPESEFASLFPDAKLVSYDKYVPTRQEKRLQITEKKLKTEQTKQDAGVQLSDDFEAHWPDHKSISFNSGKENVGKDLIKKLKMGHIPPDIEIDLHGQTSRQAKAEIIAVIFEAKKRHYPCINIIHGHGNGVLKQRVPNWLVQHPDVAGFVQAPRAFGGKAGLLVLIDIDFNEHKI